MAADRILKHIASKGFDPKKDIESELFKHTFDALNRVVGGVFGEVKYEDADFDFVNELKYNNAVFSAFKTHRQQNDIAAQMTDDKGKVRSFADFRTATAPIIGQYNTNWLHTEYNTAIIRVQYAQKIKELEQDRDIYPNLQWLASTSVNPREAHRALYGKVFAFDDPVLQTNYPGSLWGCKCGITSTLLPVTGGAEIKSALKSTPNPQPGLDVSPASGALFAASHPYIANCIGGKKTKQNIEHQAEKLISDISRKEVRKYFKETLAKEKMISVTKGPINELPLSYQDIKTITGKPHKFNYQRNQACYSLDEIFKRAKYEGASPEIKPGQLGHNSILKWHYYSFELNGEMSYVTIKESHGGGFGIHSIQDADHFKNSKVKEKPKRND